jgi:hypothetical protein
MYKQKQVQNVQTWSNPGIEWKRIQNIILRDVDMSYTNTTTTCITMKMMELFNYANIQKLPGYMVFVKKSASHDQRQFGQVLVNLSDKLIEK